MGMDARDDFTVQFEHETQHAVSCGMLTAEMIVTFLRLGDRSCITFDLSEA
jgi:hypothetical protein